MHGCFGHCVRSNSLQANLSQCYENEMLHTGRSGFQADRLPTVTTVPDLCARMKGRTANVTLAVPITLSFIIRWIFDNLGRRRTITKRHIKSRTHIGTRESVVTRILPSYPDHPNLRFDFYFQITMDSWIGNIVPALFTSTSILPHTSTAFWTVSLIVSSESLRSNRKVLSLSFFVWSGS